MSIIKWRTRAGWLEIIRVEVERETEQCVWINGRRNSKITDWECFHDSWDAAHQHLMSAAETEVAAARLRLNARVGHLGNIKGLKRPADA